MFLAEKMLLDFEDLVGSQIRTWDAELGRFLHDQLHRDIRVGVFELGEFAMRSNPSETSLVGVFAAITVRFPARAGRRFLGHRRSFQNLL